MKSSVSAITIAIRPAKPAERRALEDLQRRASTARPDYRVQLEANPDAIELPQLHINTGLVMVAEREGKVAGFAVVLPRGEEEAELDGLFVEPDIWGLGVGRKLIDAAAEFAMGALSASVLLVTANPRAVPFYHRCGFIAIGVADTRFGPAPVLALSLGD